MKLRKNGAFKLVVAVVMLLSVVLSGYLGFHALWYEKYMDDNWQSNFDFYQKEQDYYNRAFHYYEDKEWLKGGAGDFLTRQNYQDSVDFSAQRLDRQKTNFRYQILSLDGQTVLDGNLNEGERLDDIVQQVKYDTRTFAVVGDGSVEITIVEDRSYIIAYGVIDDIEATDISDEFSLIYNRNQVANNGFVSVLPSTIVALGVAAIALLILLWCAGYRQGDETVVAHGIDRIPTEIFLLVTLLISATALSGMIIIFEEVWNSMWTDSPIFDELFQMMALGMGGLLAVGAGFGAMLLCGIAVRLRCHTLWRGSLTHRLGQFLLQKARIFLLSLPIVWRAVVAFILYICLNFIARYGFGSIYPVPVFLVDAIALAVVVWWTLCFRKVRDGADAISTGNLTHRIDTRQMPIDIKSHAESMNNISAGMEVAVDSRLKSERFKAELITNVSHDLKTPLTSIINYIDLLKTTEQTDPRAAEYLEVLDRKSQRLKKLTEDLVDASKASTGAMKVEREKIGLSQLLDQAIGEYQEKLEGRSLTLVAHQPEEEIYVLADGRHLWRIVDNLLGNCVKYAMEGTRVYLEVARGHGQVTLSVKNISKEPLTISAEQLLQRFVRGEESRTSEGSGLGLSIAKSLTELQEGTFEIFLDGDLFKAVITLHQSR